MSYLKNKNTLKTQKFKHRSIKGGKVYGEGTFGVVLGDPVVPTWVTGNGDPNEYIKLNSDNNYVSKIFITRTDIDGAVKVIDILKNTYQSNFNELNKYLVLPKIIGNNVTFKINQMAYQKPNGQFQSVEYWTDDNGQSYYDDTRLRTYDAKEQIVYPKATGGSLENLRLSKYDDFSSFIFNMKNIAIGLTILHDKTLIHHDIKPGNILVFTELEKTVYKISDLDTILPINEFNKKNIQLFNISRLLNNWAYEYFPSCIILLSDVLNNPNAQQIIAQHTESDLNASLTKKSNQSNCNEVSKLFFRVINKLHQVGIQESRSILISIRNILSEKYGVTKEDDYLLIIKRFGVDNRKISIVNDTNIKIAESLNSDIELKMEDKKAILLKYVDIYAFFYSILEKLFNFIISAPDSELELSKMNIYEKQIVVCSKILTHSYFTEKMYTNTITQLYDRLLVDLTSVIRNINQTQKKPQPNYVLDNLINISGNTDTIHRRHNNLTNTQKTIIKQTSKFGLTTNLDIYNFVYNYKQLFDSISESHMEDRIHTDIFPNNIDITSSNGRLYKIKPVDELFLNLIDSSNIMKNKSIKNLLDNWYAIYYPSCITLLADMSKNTNTDMNINDIDTEKSTNQLAQGFKTPSINYQSKYLFDLFSEFKSAVHSKLPRIASLLSTQVDDILTFKYGITDFSTKNSYKLNLGIQGFNETYLQHLINLNDKILNNSEDVLCTKTHKLKNTQLQDNQYFNYNLLQILLKYVDIYSLTMVLVIEIIKYVINMNMEYTAYFESLITKIFGFCHMILTIKYFDNFIVCKNINNYYNTTVGAYGISRNIYDKLIFMDCA